MAFGGKQFHCKMSCDHELANESMRHLMSCDHELANEWEKHQLYNNGDCKWSLHAHVRTVSCATL